MTKIRTIIAKIFLVIAMEFAPQGKTKVVESGFSMKIDKCNPCSCGLIVLSLISIVIYPLLPLFILGAILWIKFKLLFVPSGGK